MPWCTLGDLLPYITGSYYKATTFAIENNMIPLEYIIHIAWQQNYVSENKKCTLYGECPGCFYWGYVEPPKVHEGLTHLFT